MITTIRDAATLLSVGPIELVAYLRSNSWKQIKQIGDRGSVWTKPADKNGEYEVLVALDRTMSEYARRVSEALQTIAVSEKRGEVEILRDITTSSADVVRVRLAHSLTEHGSIPFEHCVQMVSQAKDLLLAAACATVNPRASYGSRKPHEAVHYVNGLRMGPTEDGSFVLAIQSQVPPSLNIDDRSPDDRTTFDGEPFERRVMLRLADSLAAVQQAVSASAASGDFQPFRNAMARGVSANLCNALAGLSMDNTAEEVSFQIKWSPTRRITENVPTHFRFGHDAFPVLREAGKLLRESAPIDDFELFGLVTGLSHELETSTGRVTVSALVEGRWRKIRMDLAESDYRKAVQAHEVSNPVEAVGELVKVKRTYFLRNVREFDFLNYGDLDQEENDQEVGGDSETDPPEDDVAKWGWTESDLVVHEGDRPAYENAPLVDE